MALELALGAAAFFLAVHVFVFRVTPWIVTDNLARSRLSLAFLFLVPFGLNLWRFMAYVRRAGPTNAAFALMLHWIGFVGGMSVQFIAANAAYLFSP